MDVLTDVLDTLRLQCAAYCRTEAMAPWGLAVSAGSRAGFYVVQDGQCWLTVDGAETPLLLSAGDVVALPHGHAHVLRDDPDTAATPLFDVMPANSCQAKGKTILTLGGNGALTTLVFGSLTFEDPQSHPVLTSLPPVIHIPAEQSRDQPWLEQTLRFIACEASSDRPGTTSIISHLSHVFFIQIVRAYLSKAPDGGAGWMAALTDPIVRPALEAMHQQPDQAWTVATLADRSGLSRSAFAARFVEVVGEPPLHYLTRWRMRKAATMLKVGDETLAIVAGRVGYEAEAAFSKAFKRELGIAPGAYRREARQRLVVR